MKIFSRGSITLLIAGIVVIAIFGFICLKLGTVLLFAYALPTFTKNLATDGGLNHWLAQAVAVGFTATLLVASYSIIKSSSGNKIMKLLMLACAVIAAYSLTIYYLQKEKTQVSAEKLSDWGKEKLVTLERVKVERNTAFFDPISGAPRAWYYKHEGGELDIFSGSGKHPQLGVELKAMDNQTAKLVQQYFASNQATRMINSDTIMSQLPELAKPAPLPTPEKAKKQTLNNSPAPKVKETPTQSARKQMLVKLEQLGTYICRAQPNP